MVNVTVDGKSVDIEDSATVLDACRLVGAVPTLCRHPSLPNQPGRCGICSVDITLGGVTRIKPSCITQVADGMTICTDDQAVLHARLHALDEIRRLTPGNQILGPPDSVYTRVSRSVVSGTLLDSRAIRIDPTKCIGCERCVRVCGDVQALNVLAIDCLSSKVSISAPTLQESDCIACGQCSLLCPTSAIQEHSGIPRVLELMSMGPVCCIIAPSVRIAFPELLNLPPGGLTAGQVVTYLKASGFGTVYDVQVGADLTTIEEALEFLHRLFAPASDRPLPLMTSCCPGWIQLVRKRAPHIISHLSSCRSPAEMLARVIKKSHPDMPIISIMPCTAKKEERRFPFNSGDSINAVLTIRELADPRLATGRVATLLARDPRSWEETPFDVAYGASSTDSHQFGVSGGVSLAVLRIAAQILSEGSQFIDPPPPWLPTGIPVPIIDPAHLVWSEETSDDGRVRSTTVVFGDTPVKVAVACGAGRIQKVVAEIDAWHAHPTATPPYHLVEAMACVGGCLGGGGMPRSESATVLRDRVAVMTSMKTHQGVRNAEKSEVVRQIYTDLLGGQIGSPQAKSLLHCHITPYPPHATPTYTQPAPRDSDVVPVFYATQGGAARAVAEQACDALRQAGWRAEAASLANETATSVLANEVAAFVVSTAGNGDFPPTAMSFRRTLAGPPQRTGLRFTVLGLGDKSYDLYCQAAIDLNTLLTRLGATSMGSPVLRDQSASTSDQGAVVEGWLDAMIDDLGPGPAEPALQPRVDCPLLLTTEAADDAPPAGYTFGKVTQVDRLGAADRPSVLLTITGVKYSATDWVAVLPVAAPNVADAACRALGVDPSVRVVALHRTECRDDNAPYPPDLTPALLRTVVGRYLGLGDPVSRKLATVLLRQSASPSKRLREMSDRASTRLADEVTAGTTVLDILIETQPRVGLGRALAGLPRQRARLYSAASAPTTGDLQLLVAQHNWAGRIGVCSGYLCGLGVGDRVILRVTPGRFTVPSGAAVLIGLGCGVAPIRGLLQDMAPDQDIILFYAVRRRVDAVLDNWLMEQKNVRRLEYHLVVEMEGPPPHLVPDAIRGLPRVGEVIRAGAEVRLCGPRGVLPHFDAAFTDVVGSHWMNVKDKVMQAETN